MFPFQESLLRTIHFNASSLEERYGDELAEGSIPEDLSLEQILRWESILSSTFPGLKKRLSWYSSSQFEIKRKHLLFKETQKELNGWIGDFQVVLEAYRDHFLPPNEQILFQLEDKSTPFGELLVPWLAFARKAYRLKYPGNLLVLSRKFEQSLIAELSKCAAPSILAFFKSFIKTSNSPDTTGYNEFVLQFLGSSFVEFFTEFASLARQMVRVVRRWGEGTRLLFERLEKDKPLLEALSPDVLKMGNLVQVDTNLSTPHSVEGQICILHFENGHKWVYKPRSCAPDKVLEGLIEWINKEGELPFLRTAKILDRENYFWQEYIPHKACKSSEEFSEYFIRIGCFGALFLILGSTDYHFGNLKAFGSHPILIDNETLFSARIKIHDDFSISGDTFLDESMYHSVVHGQFLLDSARSFFPNSHSISGAFHHLDYLPVFRFSQLGTEKMDLKIEDLLIEGYNLPYCKGQKGEPLKFLSEIQNGFSRLLKFIENREKDFYAILKARTDDYSIPFRILLKPSSFYHSILLKSFEPEKNKDGVERSLHFEKLATQYLRSGSYQSLNGIFRKELELAEEQLIPWFHMKLNDFGIHSYPGAQENTSVILNSAKEIIMARRTRLKQGQLLEKNSRILNFYYNPQEKVHNEGLYHEMNHLFFCYEQHFDLESFKKMMRRSPEGLVSSFSLGKGISGILIAFAAWHRIHKDEKFKAFIYRILDEVTIWIKDMPPFQLKRNGDFGLINGFGSIILGFYHLSNLLDDPTLLQSIKLLISKSKITDINDTSFGRGQSGFLYSICLLSNLLDDDELLSLISDLLIYSERWFEQDIGRLGLVNGLAGKLFSLCTTFRITNDSKIKDIINRQVKEIKEKWMVGKEIPDHSLFNGYCGLLLLDKYLENIGLEPIFDENQFESAQKRLSFNKTLPDYLSFGNAGIAEVINTTDNYLKEDREHWNRSWNLNMLKSGKYKMSPKFLNPRFYDGSSGILYTKLRLQFPKVLPFIWPEL